MSDPFTQPTLPDIYGAIATAAGQVSGIAVGHYPAPNQLSVLPALIVMGSTGTIAHGPTQMWVLRVLTHLAVAMKGAPALEIQAVDGLLMPLVDAFAADVEDTAGFTLGGLVDRCVVADWDELGYLGYGGGVRYWGIPVYFEIKHHRHASGG